MQELGSSCSGRGDSGDCDRAAAASAPPSPPGWGHGSSEPTLPVIEHLAVCLVARWHCGDIHWRFLSLVSWRFPPSLQIVPGRSRTASVDLGQCPVVDQTYQSFQRMLQLVIDCRVSTMIYIYNHTTHNTAVSTSTCAPCNGS